jgi:hypothetical protein
MHGIRDAITFVHAIHEDFTFPASLELSMVNQPANEAGKTRCWIVTALHVTSKPSLYITSIAD